jgi:uncharacterized protein (DUF1697 family)
MPRYFAFLRAINVGGHTVKMDELRRLFEAMGFAEVATHLASGNVIFSAPDDDTAAFEAHIASGLQQALGYEVATFVRSADELVAIAAYQPFGRDDGGQYVAFLAALPAPEIQQRLLAEAGEADRFQFHGRELYWWCAGRFSDSPFAGARLEQRLGAKATVRGLNTVEQLVDRYLLV